MNKGSNSLYLRKALLCSKNLQLFSITISLGNDIFHINSGLNSMLAAPREHKLLDLP